VHRIHYEPRRNCLTVAAELVPITGLIADEPATQAVVERWVEIAFAGFRADGFEPEQIAATTTVPLDGREAIIRNQSNGLTDLIAQAMLQAAPDAELSIFNGGAIRIDDVLPPGPITEYDIIRILPFGGDITMVEMEGELLARVLTTGQDNRGQRRLFADRQCQRRTRELVDSRPALRSQSGVSGGDRRFPPDGTRSQPGFPHR
jgi:5'-nucleotidase/UDP-sugar diphosphatase